MGRTVSLIPDDVSTHSLRASGDMVMLLGGIDGNVMCILGQRKLDTILCYLHVSAKYLTHKHAYICLEADTTTF